MHPNWDAMRKELQLEEQERVLNISSFITSSSATVFMPSRELGARWRDGR